MCVELDLTNKTYDMQIVKFSSKMQLKNQRLVLAQKMYIAMQMDCPGNKKSLNCESSDVKT
jgi:hypothetical protein